LGATNPRQFQNKRIKQLDLYPCLMGMTLQESGRIKTMTRANLVLYNGVIHTMDDRLPRAQAVAIAGNRVLALGDDATARELLAPGGEAIDLKGRAVVPGFVDSHLHFVEYVLRLRRIDLAEVPTLDEALARVAARATQTPLGEWLLGGGWNRNLWPGGAFPTRADLDAVAPQHPVALTSKDCHVIWLNSRALAQVGITAQTPDPAGGKIERDAAGEPTGILKERATKLAEEAIAKPPMKTLLTLLREGIANAQRAGLVGIHDCEDGRAFTAFQILHRQDELGLRVLMHIPVENLETAIQLGLRSGYGDDFLRVGGVKIFADGALGARTAVMLEPYEGEPDNRGIVVAPLDELRRLVSMAHQSGLSVAVHAIGDSANRTVLDALTMAVEQPRTATTPALPHRIEHVQLLHPADVPRLAKLGVVASMQPIHATSDMEIADAHWGARSRWAYAWRSLLQSGTVLAFGSDCPVESLDPLRGIHAAVTRRRPDGSPGEEGWYPAQRLTVAEAVRAYTRGAAYAAGQEAVTGSITPGKLADLVALSRDIFTCDPMDILDTEVLATVLDGRFVYRAAALN
jgi:predicted amidohydrolase YtcJ